MTDSKIIEAKATLAFEYESMPGVWVCVKATSVESFDVYLMTAGDLANYKTTRAISYLESSLTRLSHEIYFKMNRALWHVVIVNPWSHAIHINASVTTGNMIPRER